MDDSSETGALSWADMVEEDLEQQQHLDIDSSPSESPITDTPPPTRSWASLVAGRLHDPEPRPTQQATVDTKLDTEIDETNIQVSKWHAYAKTLQEEEAAEEAARRAKADAAGPMSLPSDSLVRTTYSPDTGLEASRWNRRDDPIDGQSVGEGLAASRWANAPRTGRYGEQYGGSSDNGSPRLNKFYGDRDRDVRSNRYDNGARRYDNNGASWNYPDRRDGSNNWRAGNRNDNYSNSYDSSRRHDGNDNSSRHDNHRTNEHDPTSRPWPRGQSIEPDVLPNGGAVRSKWAQSHKTPTQSKWGPLLPDSPTNGLDTHTAIDSPTTDDHAPLTSITTTFAAMTTAQPSMQPASNDNESLQDNTTATTVSSGATGTAVNEKAGETWDEPTATAPSSGEETTMEEAPSWGANQVEQAPAEPAVKITSWKEVIGAPIDNDNEPGLANQAWKLAAAAAPPRTRRMSTSAPSTTYSQGSNIPHLTNDQQTSQAPSWSTDNAKTEDLPAPSWSTDNAKTEDLPAPSWPAVENTPQDSTFTPSHDNAPPPPAVDQPQEQTSANNEANPWKAFASKEVERHPRLPPILHTRPLRDEQHSSGHHPMAETSHSTTTMDSVDSQFASAAQTTDDSWENLQAKMANSWST